MTKADKLLRNMAILAVILLALSLWSICHAAEITLWWDANPEPDIACYKVYMGTQVDMSTWTWEQIGEVPAPTTEFVYDAPTELRLFRISACDTTGQESIRYNAGVFSCPDWAPPIDPSNAGIK